MAERSKLRGLSLNTKVTTCAGYWTKRFPLPFLTKTFDYRTICCNKGISMNDG